MLHHWHAIKNHTLKPSRCLIGFDGFTDEIVSVVDTRSSVDDFNPLTSITAFGERILEAAGKSCNIEFVLKQAKIGGNAPIMTNALLQGGHFITFSGTIGTKEHIEPLFESMASQCETVIPLGPSNHSDALEFNDGKIIFGKLFSLKNVTYDNLLKAIPEKKWVEFFNVSDLFVSANWTMLPFMTDIWKNILLKIAPCLPKDRTRWMFVDLADPAKRSDDDLREAMAVLKLLNHHFQVILGLNHAEAERLSKVFGLSEKDVKKMAQSLFETLGLHQIVIHNPYLALQVNVNGVSDVKSFHAEKPLLTTGAGDNFNAGFCNALLYGLSLEECLLSAVGTSGFYVRKGYSPTMEELADFLAKQK